ATVVQHLPSTTTDADGRFVLQHAPAPDLYIRVFRKGEYKVYMAPVRPIEPGQTKDLGEIAVEPMR
ncbi:carboxypeptidase-like regulatory domain-containing protein, partial [bacterium]|nr:carboxypeptidase-like regulatory domain-containing protein [bacterium]